MPSLDVPTGTGPRIVWWWLFLSFALLANVRGAGPGPQRFDLPAGEATVTLKMFAGQAGREILFGHQAVVGVYTQAVSGRYLPLVALDRMLQGTGLIIVEDTGTGALLVNRPPPPPMTPRSTDLPATHPPSTNLSPNSPVKRKTFLALLSGWLTAITAPLSSAQSNNPAALEPDGSVIQLSPFVVNAEADTGYAASQTLAGSRFNTDLKDTAASISVFTSDFISDLGANNLEEVLRYSVSAQLDIGDSSADGANPNGTNVQSEPAFFRVRGQKTTKARNYFTLWTQSDNYNVERIEDSRGPNSVLFGFGAPGGILNVSTKQARLDKSFEKGTVQVGSFGSHRGTLDINEVLLNGKFALRLNALYEYAGKFQEYAFNRDRRFDLALKYKMTPTLNFRASIERYVIRENKNRPFTLLDGGVLLWQELGSQTLPASIPTNAGLGVTRLSTSTRRLTYVGNDNTLIEMRGSMVTTGTNTSILDPQIANPVINYGGPGQINNNDGVHLTVFLEKRLGSQTFLEFAYNHQQRTVDRYNPGQSNMNLWADPNQKLNGTANPHVGELFFETSTNDWEHNYTDDSSDLFRATLSSELDIGKWGNYRFALLGEHDRRGSLSLSEREAWEGAPFTSAPESGANQVKRRNYLTPGVWSTYFINSPVITGLVKGAIDPVTGQTLNSVWVPRSQSQQDDPEVQKSALLAGQARYFKGRLVVSGGIRYDRLDILDRTAQRDPVTNMWSLAQATEVEVEREARNSSFGAVAHLTDHISVHYNRANNQGLGGSQRIIDINNLNGPTLTAPNSKGEGQDFGVSLNLFDGKINLRAIRYTTDAVDLVDSFSPTAVGPDKVADNILSTLRDAGLVTQAVVDARTPTSNGVKYDTDSKGYEFSLTTNMTKNWRLQLNYSYTDTHNANFGTEIRAWMDHEIPYWQSFNRGSLVTGSGGRTIDEAIDFMLSQFAVEANLEKLGERGLRKNKVNFFTRYDFSANRLKGLYVGGGYQHQSKSLAGSDADNSTAFYGNSFWQADMMMGYKFRSSLLRRLAPFAKGLSIQLNVLNVTNEDDPLIIRIMPDGVSVQRAVVQTPRTWRLQANLEF